MPAVLAALDMAAKGSGAAALDRRHHLELGEAQMPGLGGTVSWTFRPEDVCDLILVTNDDDHPPGFCIGGSWSDRHGVSQFQQRYAFENFRIGMISTSPVLFHQLHGGACGVTPISRSFMTNQLIFFVAEAIGKKTHKNNPFAGGPSPHFTLARQSNPM